MTVLLAATQCLQGCDYRTPTMDQRLVGMLLVLALVTIFSLGPALVFHLMDRNKDQS